MSQARKRILWVKSGPLHPLDTGGKKRTFNMVRELHRQHEVTYLALRPEGTPEEVLEAAEEYSTTAIWIDWKAPKTIPAVVRNALFSSYPFVLEKYFHEALKDRVASLMADGGFDLVVCDFLTLAPQFPVREAGHPPVVLFQHNMEAQIWERMAKARSNPLVRWYFHRQYLRMRRWEADLSRNFEGVITVSEDDSAYARREYGLDNVLGAVPTGVDFDYFEAPNRQGGGGRVVGFLGSMDWMPNIEAATYFVSEIFPVMQRQLGEARLIIIGRNPAPSVRALQSEENGITVTGTVDDVRSYLGDCDVLVVPLLSGGGTRIKIMEAVAAGLPVVSTTVGAEGLDLESGKEILIEDEPDAFATAVVCLCEDEERRRALAAAALASAKKHGSWEVVTAIFMKHCEEVLG